MRGRTPVTFLIKSSNIAVLVVIINMVWSNDAFVIYQILLERPCCMLFTIGLRVSAKTYGPLPSNTLVILEIETDF
jgi:Na+/H+-translocating membrane pyrophosphatase